MRRLTEQDHHHVPLQRARPADVRRADTVLRQREGDSDSDTATDRRGPPAICDAIRRQLGQWRQTEPHIKHDDWVLASEEPTKPSAPRELLAAEHQANTQKAWPRLGQLSGTPTGRRHATQRTRRSRLKHHRRTVEPHRQRQHQRLQQGRDRATTHGSYRTGDRTPASAHKRAVTHRNLTGPARRPGRSQRRIS